MVAHLARLAGLKVSPEQLPRFAQEMDSLVRMISTVKGANTDGVEPFVSFAREGRNAEGAWIREDVPSSGERGGTIESGTVKREERSQELLKHAEKLDKDYYVVKKPVQGEQ